MAITQPMAIEHHCLKVRYAHLRLHEHGAVEKLAVSIEQHGQLVPVVLVKESTKQWVLIDGHLRVNALKRLGKDTVEANIWLCNEADALIRLINNHPARGLAAFEEALLLHELYTQHALSQHKLATRLGRDQSWVSRRLSLVEDLPVPVLNALLKSTISLWVATRVLVPMARAIPKHMEFLLNYLLKHSHSTREIWSFYEHYQNGNRQERSKMVNNPELFFKAKRHLEVQKKANILQDGPEGQWQYQCDSLIKLLLELTQLAPKIIYPNQSSLEHSMLLQSWQQAKTLFKTLMGLLE